MATKSAFELNQELADLIKEERKLTRAVLDIISQFDRQKFYSELGYTSAMTWLIDEHRFSKSAAYRRLQAARLIRAVPSAKTSLVEGKLNITTMSALQTAIRQEEARTRQPLSPTRKQELVSRIESKPSEQADRVIETEFPMLKSSETDENGNLKHRDNSLTLVLSHERMDLLERAKLLVTKARGGAEPTWAELIETLALEFLNLRNQESLSGKSKGLRIARSAPEPEVAAPPKPRARLKNTFYPHG